MQTTFLLRFFTVLLAFFGVYRFSQPTKINTNSKADSKSLIAKPNQTLARIEPSNSSGTVSISKIKDVTSKQKTKNKKQLTTNTYTPVPGDTSGYSAGSFGVSDAGSANYSLPITCSPGTAGVEPKVALSYNSQGGNGLVGQGWSIGGLSLISRSTKTLAQDGVVRAVDVSGDDTYSLDGERIVPILGANGANGTEYRTEQNAFLKVVSYGNVNGSPEYYKAWTKDGLVMEFGNTTDSRIEAQNSTNILFWLLNRITDTKGNYMTVSYFEDNATGEYRPTQINYTGNSVTGASPYASVVFNYITRNDVNSKFVAGYQVQNTQLLSSVQCFYQSTLFRSYALTYQYATTTGTPLLAEIKECGMNGECFKPTKFHWIGEQTFSMTAATGTTIPATDLNTTNKYLYNGDWNGDGMGDYMIYDYSTGTNKWFFNNTNGNTLDFGTTALNVIPTAGLNSAQLIATDFNSDGWTDIFWFNPANNTHKLFVNNKTATLSFTQQNSLIDFTSYPNNTTQIQLGDYDGNGQTDILLYVPSTGQNRIFLNQTTTGAVTFGAGLNSLFPTSQVSSSLTTTIFSAIDIDANGLSDAVWYDKTTGTNRWFVNTGNGAAPAFSQVTNPIANTAITGGKKIDFGDFNADGNVDVMWYEETTGSTKFFYNKGKLLGLGSANFIQENNANLTPSTISGASNDIELYVTDVNADGMSDLVRYRKADGTNRFFLNKGKCDFSTNYNAAIPTASVTGGEGIGITSFRKRGLTDVIWHNKSNGATAYFRSSLTTANLIDSITTGHGSKVFIGYSPLLEDTVYTKEKTALFPMYDMEAKFYVVSGFSTDDGTIAGGRNRMKYFYKGAKIHTQGRGFRGFREIVATDVSTNTQERKVFKQDHRYISTPIDTSETRVNGQLISRTVNSNGLKQYTSTIPGLTVHYSFSSESNTKEWDLNGTMVSNKTVRQTMDDYGNPLTVVLDHGNGCKDSTFNVYNNYVQGQWILGRLQSATVTRFAPNTPTITRQSAFTYDINTGLRTQDILDANLPTISQVTKNYTFDARGNIPQSSEVAFNGQVMETRTTATTYDAQGRFSISVTNPKGQTSTSTYHQTLGVPLTVTDANNLTTTRQYDGFGRRKMETYPDGNWTAWDYRLCKAATNPANTPSHAVFYIYQQSSVNPPTITWYDKLDREIRSQAVSFGGTAVLVDKEYDYKGRVTRTSNPYFVGTATGSIQWTNFYYDVLGRDTLTVLPGNRKVKTQYNGLQTISTNPLNQTKKVVKDLGGRVTNVYDAQNNMLSYQYDAAGRTKNITAPLNSQIQFVYDLFGNKTQEIDPDRGTENYQYNAFGQLIQKTDAKGAITQYGYDIMGRMISLKRAEDTVTWVYDTAPNGVGALASVSSTKGHSLSYTYDNLGRKSSMTITIQGVSYTFSYTYDLEGRLFTTQYPITGLRTRNVYNTNGFLAEVRNDVSNALYWQANSYNAKGQLLQETLGNGTVTNYTYHATNDWLQQIITTKNGTTIQNLSHQFDAGGNMTWRRDNTRNLQEDFLYDNLNRLIQSAIAGIGMVNLTYDVLGNILTKSDVGTYSYLTGTHKLTGVTTNNSGVCIPSFQAQFLYTSYDKVRQITLDSTRLELQYGYDAQRIIQKLFINDTLRETKYYIGGLYEKKVDKNGTVTHIQYIQGGNGIVAIYTQNNAGNSTQYLHKDHLGSVQAITDANGTLIQEFSYDAWGKRRNPNWTPITGVFTSATDRGYTGHEHLDIFSLINMNGRVYDPVLGRFIQADPFVQDYSNIQSLNRYAYVLNNPLAYTDPSGYFSFKKFFRNVGNFFKDNWKQAVTIAAVIGVGILTGGTFIAAYLGASAAWAPLVGTIISGAAAGFAGGVTGTLLNGGSIGDALKSGLKGAAIGALSAGLTYGVGNMAANIADKNIFAGFGSKIVGHGIVQGAMEELQGGKFSSGFISGAFAAAVTPFTSDINNSTMRVVAGAIVGGTASKLGGGKFANGAMSGAFVAMYNQNQMGERDAGKRVMNYLKEGLGDLNSVCNLISPTVSTLNLACFSSVAGELTPMCWTANAVGASCLVIGTANYAITPTSSLSATDNILTGSSAITTIMMNSSNNVVKVIGYSGDKALGITNMTREVIDIAKPDN